MKPRAVVLIISAMMSCVVSQRVQAQQAAAESPWGVYPKPAENEYRAWERYYIEGFTWPTSIKPGDTLRVYVSVGDTLGGQNYDLQIYRIPDPTSVMQMLDVQGQFFPLHDSSGQAIIPGDYTRRPVDYRNGCRTSWQQGSITLSNTGSWQNGFYYVKLTHRTLPGTHDEKYYYIPFIVRASSPGTTSKILFKFDLNTYQAYNYWGGGSLYSQSQSPSLAQDTMVAMDRPLWRLAGQLITQFSIPQFVKLLQDSGYTMEYCDNIDLDKAGSGFGIDLLQTYRMLVLWNHDEYWSRNERANTEAFKGDRQSGFHGNIARFAPNTCYWRIAWLEGANGPHDKFYCLKNNRPSSPPPVDLWRYDGSGGANNPEARLLAIQYERGWNAAGDSIATEPPDRVVDASHWIFRNTSLMNGAEFGFGFTDNLGRHGLVNYELDNLLTGQDSVKFLKYLLADTTAMSNLGNGNYGLVRHHMVYAEDSTTNSRLFASGTGNWWYAFDSRCDSATDVHRMKTITTNIFDHFSGKKYIGKVYTRPQFPLEWTSSVNIDGDVEILAGKYLITTNNTITIDTSYGCYTYGTLEVNGTVNVAGQYNDYAELYIGNSGKLLVKSGATLNINPAINLILANGATVELEQNASIKINAGGLLELLGDVTWVFGTGSKIEVSGDVQVAANTALTIPFGGQLRVNPGSEFQFGDATQLVAYGPVTAIGTDQQPIIFGKLSTASSWLGIHIESGLAVSELRHCVITDAITGVSANSSRFKLKESFISECTEGIDISGYHPKFYYQIDSNTVQNCSTSGIVIGNANAVTLHDNIVSGCTVGIVTIQGTSRLYRNRIENSAEEGVFAGEYSNPRLGDVLLADPGNNVIRNSGIAELHAVNSTPFLGVGCERMYGGWNSIYGAGFSWQCFCDRFFTFYPN